MKKIFSFSSNIKKEPKAVKKWMREVEKIFNRSSNVEAITQGHCDIMVKGCTAFYIDENCNFRNIKI